MSVFILILYMKYRDLLCRRYSCILSWQTICRIYMEHAPLLFGARHACARIGPACAPFAFRIASLCLLFPKPSFLPVESLHYPTSRFFSYSASLLSNASFLPSDPINQTLTPLGSIASILLERERMRALSPRDHGDLERCPRDHLQALLRQGQGPRRELPRSLP